MSEVQQSLMVSIGLFYSFFKELNDIPMSTTWVFVGLLCGRELAMATMTGKEKFKVVFPLIGKDFLKMMVGLGRICGCCSCNSLCHSTKRTIGDSARFGKPN